MSKIHWFEARHEGVMTGQHGGEGGRCSAFQGLEAEVGALSTQEHLDLMK